MVQVSLSVPKYEEQTDANGNFVTYYLVCVEAQQFNIKYYLKKRYSSFGTLYDVLKSNNPQVDAFKFPNKSMFNTHAQFTKERRRVGFDEFLLIVV